MKSLTKNVFAIILTIFCLSACSTEQVRIEKSLKNSGSRLYTAPKATKNTSFIIYDSKNTGLGMVSVELKSPSGNLKKDLVTAFLTHNHFLQHSDQITLTKIEEIDDATNFYLNMDKSSERPEQLSLFKSALELTIMRHLKNKNFNIIYG